LALAFVARFFGLRAVPLARRLAFGVARFFAARDDRFGVWARAGGRERAGGCAAGGGSISEGSISGGIGEGISISSSMFGRRLGRALP
jgi:hypothetical protein